MRPRRVLEEVSVPVRRRLGNAEFSRGSLFIRLSRTVDPSRKRYLVEDPAITTLEQAKRLAHRLSGEALDFTLRASLTPIPRPPSAGVYFVRVGGRVKIGKANNVAARVRNLQTATPEKLCLVAVARGGNEAAYHSRFAHLRVRGEWFRLAPDLVAEISTLREGVEP